MSTIKANTLLHSDGSTTTQPSIPALDKRMAKAWCVWNGTSTVSIYDSFNISSVADNGTGDYTVNFTTAMANNNYAVSGMSDDVGMILALRDQGYTNTAWTRLASTNHAGSFDDATRLMANWFGN